MKSIFDEVFGDSEAQRKKVMAETGFKIHQVRHPYFGLVGELWVDGKETPEELAAFEKAVFERLELDKMEAEDRARRAQTMKNS